MTEQPATLIADADQPHAANLRAPVLPISNDATA